MKSRRCAECGHRASAGARFCEQCGAVLTPHAPPLRALQGERKQVTVMYTDVVGSMELTQSLGSERWGVVLDRFLAIAARAVHRLEGTVNQMEDVFRTVCRKPGSTRRPAR